MTDNSTLGTATPSETPVFEENPVSPDTTESIPMADSQITDPLPEAPESPKTEADTPVVILDNQAPTQPESQTPETPNQPQIKDSPVATATSPSSSSSSSFSFRDLLNKARETIQFRKRKKLDKIMELLNKKNKISNNDVTNLLHVSDATATRYLNILEQERKITQAGKTGKSVFYTKL
ncbi:MAG: DeoR family transcriptional regulator [Minisyncoccia bacterium]